MRHATPASRWRAAPLPDGSRTRWITTKGFKSYRPPSQGFGLAQCDSCLANFVHSGCFSRITQRARSARSGRVQPGRRSSCRIPDPCGEKRSFRRVETFCQKLSKSGRKTRWLPFCRISRWLSGLRQESLPRLAIHFGNMLEAPSPSLDVLHFYGSAKVRLACFHDNFTDPHMPSRPLNITVLSPARSGYPRQANRRGIHSARLEQQPTTRLALAGATLKQGELNREWNTGLLHRGLNRGSVTFAVPGHPGKLCKRFRATDVRWACPGCSPKRYSNFLPKHRVGNLGGNTELSEGHEDGSYGLAGE